MRWPMPSKTPLNAPVLVSVALVSLPMGTKPFVAVLLASMSAISA